MVIKRMLLNLLTAMFILANSHSLFAQENANVKKDEQALRDLIEQQNKNEDVIKFTDESIFVSGAFPRPIIGRQQREANLARREELAKSRPNQQTKQEMQRLVVSKSGDLAYDFGDFTISYDGADKKRTGFSGSYLRVWRKISGTWMVDAFFARPNQP